MVFVFTFLGEFGYELLNWQGRIRKFSTTLTPSESIVCCSRAQVYPLYEMAELYVDISALTLFKHSRASCYSATVGIGASSRWPNRAFDAGLRASVRSFVRRRLEQLEPQTRPLTGQDLVFVFSSGRTELRGFTFGCDPNRLETDDADVFDRLDVDANLYRKLEPDLRLREKIEQRIGFDLAQPYVLIQTRSRRVGPQSGIVPKEELIGALGETMKVVLLSFETSRAFDSASRFDPLARCIHYTGRSFPEQACLVHFARHCVFLTEGDFGSHIYVPPFMGKDVVAVAPRSVYTLGTTPIEFWNRRVFRFGGQIVPQVSEDVLASAAGARKLAGEILNR